MINKKMDKLPAEEQPRKAQKKQHDVFMKVSNLQEKNYTDQTGQFPYISSKRN